MAGLVLAIPSFVMAGLVPAILSFVMAGLVPAIHVLLVAGNEDVDARHLGVRKHAVLRTPMAGHDDLKTYAGNAALAFSTIA